MAVKTIAHITDTHLGQKLSLGNGPVGRILSTAASEAINSKGTFDQFV